MRALCVISDMYAYAGRIYVLFEQLSVAHSIGFCYLFRLRQR